MSRSRRRVTALLGVSAVSVATALTAAGTARAATATTSFPGAVPGWATAANDQGAADPAETVEGELFLPLRDLAGAQALATAVSTPGNPKYRHWLSPQQWISTFSPTKSDFTEVRNYLTDSGFTISASPKSRQFIVFRGTVSAMDAAFGTSLHTYQVGQASLVGPDSAPALPASVGSKVLGLSIDTSRLLTRPDLVHQQDPAGPTPQLRTAAPPAPPVPPVETQCSTWFGQHQATLPRAYGKYSFDTYICGYVPSQLRSAYGVSKLINSGTDGSGQTVAIIDAYASPTILGDVNTYARQTGQSVLTSRAYKQIVPRPQDFVDQDLCGEPSGWQEEQTLDVEAAHGLAPGAGILYVGGFNCAGGLDIAMSTILDDKLATIVSNSYGDVGEAVPDNYLLGTVDQHLQAAVEGIGLYYSSGDNGDEAADLGFTSPDFPASSPWVTSVGGTSLGINANGSYGFEAGWGSTRDQVVPAPDGSLTYAEPLPGSAFRGGAGGGTSAAFAQPAYQKGVVPAALAQGPDGTPSRVSPDIASLADPYTGMLLGLSPINDDVALTTDPFTTETIGGTSLATPLAAAQAALVQQAAGAAIGFANPAIYGLYRSTPSAFRDVRPFSPPKAVAFSSDVTGASYLVTFDRDTSLATRKGYDPVTGLGSVSVPAVASYVRK